LTSGPKQKTLRFLSLRVLILLVKIYT
jgi:hypothetical protein